MISSTRELGSELSHDESFGEVHGPWLCVQSQPKHEHLAAEHLRKVMRLEVFLPRIRFRKMTRQRGVMWVTEALFPNYLFARFKVEQIPQVRSSHGVSRIVQFGGKPSMIEDEIIGALRSSVGDGDLCQMDSGLKKGDEVVITDGAFQGLKAVVTNLLPAKERVRLLIEFLGRKTEVVASKGSLLKAGTHPLTC